MKRSVLRSLLAPAAIAVVSGWALVAALLDDGAVEYVAVAALAAVVALTAWKLSAGWRRNGR